jgi:hypothetical protein
MKLPMNGAHAEVPLRPRALRHAERAPVRLKPQAMNPLPADSSSRLESQSYKVPVADLQFLLRDEMRAVRFALEYARADLLLRDWGVRSTIIVFGSARIPSPERRT